SVTDTHLLVSAAPLTGVSVSTFSAHCVSNRAGSRRLVAFWQKVSVSTLVRVRRHASGRNSKILYLGHIATDRRNGRCDTSPPACVIPGRGGPGTRPRSAV